MKEITHFATFWFCATALVLIVVFILNKFIKDGKP